jgi:polyhydroxyalkanoate synthesis repressor PhaR
MTAESRLIKKFGNRRLYDTATSSYITLGDIKNLVLDQVAFRIVDAKTREDLTHRVLLQVMVAEENAAPPIFSSESLSQIIRLYGAAMQGSLVNYIEKNLQTFAQIQLRLQAQSVGKPDDNPVPNMEAWNDFVSAQGTAIEALMTSYLDQSAQTLLEMQRQFQKQTSNMFEAFRFTDTRGPDSLSSAKHAAKRETKQTKPAEVPEGEEKS